jgi:hypothetical protein
MSIISGLLPGLIDWCDIRVHLLLTVAEHVYSTNQTGGHKLALSPVTNE